METYEIHLLAKDGKTSSVCSSSHTSDHAAVRRAKLLTQDGGTVEVWRGGACVYSGASEKVSASEPAQPRSKAENFTKGF